MTPALNKTKHYDFLETYANKSLIALNVFLALIYFFVLAFYFPAANRLLFWLLMAGEVFHIWQALTFLYTVWETDPKMPEFDSALKPFVDVFITVAGEPVEIVRTTALAAANLNYSNFKVYLLNDGFVAKKENWQEIVALAKELNVQCITRRIPGGAKAGNINNALKKTKGQLVAVFDADHVPKPDFLLKTVGYFTDPKMGFVQTPQFYRNQNESFVAQAAWNQQALFFGPICKGKNRLNSVTMCGTNMVISRRALNDVNGICEENIAEDFLTGLFLHNKGWKSVYVPEVLAEGLAPEDLLSYTKQQFRWARGSLEVIFKYNPLFSRTLSWAQKIQYLSSASFFLSGAVVLLNALFPLIFFFFGLVPLQISTMALAVAFLPYIFLTVYLLKVTTNSTFSFRALSFCMSTFTVQIKALLVTVLNIKSGFVVTPKSKLNGNFIRLAIPHIIYLLLIPTGVVVGVMREGLSVSLITNLSWALFNAAVFIPFINASLPQTQNENNAVNVSNLLKEKIYANHKPAG